MSFVPNCPDHGTPMRPSTKGGGFFCTRKVGTEYCTRRFTAAQVAEMAQRANPGGGGGAPVPVGNPSSSSPQPVSARDGKYHLAAAALTAASWVWGQVDPTMHAEVELAAERFYKRMKALAEMP